MNVAELQQQYDDKSAENTYNMFIHIICENDHKVTLEVALDSEHAQIPLSLQQYHLHQN